MSKNSAISIAKPWYREPWPWYLMAGPFVVVIAALTTAWIAYSSSDGLVADDYYKQGLAVNQTLSRSREASNLGLEVRAHFSAEGVDLNLRSVTNGKFVPPKTLILTVSHPTRAGLDQAVALNGANGRYAGKLRLPVSGHWLVLVEDEAKTWRLMGNVMLPALGETVIGGEISAGKDS